MRLKLLIPSFLFFISLNINSTAQTLTKVITQTTYLTAVNNTAVSADYIQMLWGKEAVATAKKEGHADMDVDKNGKKTWFVPNDYYIVNSNKKIRRLPLAKDLEVVLVKDMSSELGTSTLVKLKKNYKNNIFKLYIRNNEVIKIEQIFVP